MNYLRPRHLLVLAALVLSADVSAVVIDSVVATVGREPILYSELYRDAQQDLEELRRNSSSESAYNRALDRLLSDTLDQIVESKILYREAQLLGLEVSDERIEERIDTLREYYPTNEAFLQDLEEAGETMRDFRERIRKRLLAQSMAYGKLVELEGAAVVSQEAIQAYYEENIQIFRRPERVRVRQIFLTAPSSDSDAVAAARSRMTLVLEELNAGAAFEDLARQYSEAPGALEGGIIGWQQRGDLIEVLDEAAFSLESGASSGMLQSTTGIHILNVDERLEAGVADIGEVHNEIEPIIRSSLAQEAFDKWIGELRKRSRVRIFI